MNMRKIGATKLFDGYRMLEKHVLMIWDDGTVEAVVPIQEAGEGVAQLDGVLTPGFVNCHCHLELSHMKGKIPERTGLVDFVFKVVTERKASEEEVAAAITNAEQEMKRGGIVAVGDICNNTSTLAQKQKNILRYYNFIESSGWLPTVSGARFETAKRLSDAFREQSANDHQQINCSIVPHAPYSVSHDLWLKLQPEFRNKVVSIHNQETVFEDEFFLKGTGDFERMYALMKIDNAHYQPTAKSSLQSYFHKLSGAEKIILVHNTFTRQEDLDFVRKANGEWSVMNSESKSSQPQTPNSKLQTFFCLCVNANQYIENALPPINLLRENNCTLVLGTDSLASNWSLSIADEMKSIRKHFPAITLDEMLRWATINGATALGFEKQLGSFEKGKRPGCVLLSEKDLEVRRLL